MERALRECAVERAGLVPFIKLSQLIAHEIELFAGMREHIKVHRARLRILVLFVRAPHFLHDGGLAVYDLVVREGEQVALVREIVH